MLALESETLIDLVFEWFIIFGSNQMFWRVFYCGPSTYWAVIIDFKFCELPLNIVNTSMVCTVVSCNSVWQNTYGCVNFNFLRKLTFEFYRISHEKLLQIQLHPHHKSEQLQNHLGAPVLIEGFPILSKVHPELPSLRVGSHPKTKSTPLSLDLTFCALNCSH
jgi:hypothetical protein